MQVSNEIFNILSQSLINLFVTYDNLRHSFDTDEIEVARAQGNYQGVMRSMLELGIDEDIIQATVKSVRFLQGARRAANDKGVKLSEYIANLQQEQGFKPGDIVTVFGLDVKWGIGTTQALVLDDMENGVFKLLKNGTQTPGFFCKVDMAFAPIHY
jgi:hypothetical protein